MALLLIECGLLSVVLIVSGGVGVVVFLLWYFMLRCCCVLWFCFSIVVGVSRFLLFVFLLVVTSVFC